MDTGALAIVELCRPVARIVAHLSCAGAADQHPVRDGVGLLARHMWPTYFQSDLVLLR